MLTLPIKRKWFDMILSGEKKEEYREMTPYWGRRFENLYYIVPQALWPIIEQKIKFRNGYAADAPSFVASVTISTGYGREEWGAEPGKKYFILKIRKVEETNDA